MFIVLHVFSPTTSYQLLFTRVPQRPQLITLHVHLMSENCSTPTKTMSCKLVSNPTQWPHDWPKNFMTASLSCVSLSVRLNSMLEGNLLSWIMFLVRVIVQNPCCSTFMVRHSVSLLQKESSCHFQCSRCYLATDYLRTVAPSCLIVFFPAGFIPNILLLHQKYKFCYLRDHKEGFAPTSCPLSSEFLWSPISPKSRHLISLIFNCVCHNLYCHVLLPTVISHALKLLVPCFRGSQYCSTRLLHYLMKFGIFCLLITLQYWI